MLIETRKLNKREINVVTSLDVAETFEKEHYHVMEDIREIQSKISTPPEFSGLFYEGEYKASNGKKNPMYYMNRDGFSLLAMRFTGKKALEWKLKYIMAFNEMEKQLKERQSIQWQQTRLAAKDMRKLETAEIKELVQYAQTQGSKNAKKYYLALSKLANKMIGLSGGQREQASVTQLNRLTLVENIIHHVIQEGIEKQLPYKQIYQICKARPEQFKKLYISRTNFKKVLDK